MTGTLTTPTIERWLHLRAAPERVWRALTVPEELAAWFGQRADLAPEVGYEGWIEWEGHGRYAMRVVEVAPPVRLAVRWMNEAGVPLDLARATLVEWDLAPTAAGGTRLHLRESGFPSTDARAGNAVGWLGELGELAEYVAEAPWATIRRTYSLGSPIDMVWRAFEEPARFATWWPGSGRTSLAEGATGWWQWPDRRERFAFRIEAVDAPTYLAWDRSLEPEVPLSESIEVLHTEWALEPREDGGTDLHLLETGFAGPNSHASSATGWDAEVIPVLRRGLGEKEP